MRWDGWDAQFRQGIAQHGSDGGEHKFPPPARRATRVGTVLHPAWKDGGQRQIHPLYSRSVADELENVEESGARGAAGDRDPGRVDQGGGLHGVSIGDRSQRVFGGGFVERVEGVERRSQGLQRCRELSLQVFPGSSFVESDRGRKERRGLHDEPGEAREARLEEVDDGEVPRAPFPANSSRQSPASRKYGSILRPSSSVGSRMMYCWFTQSSFSGLNTAFPPLIPSSAKAAISSSRLSSSRSSPGDHPSSARKFTIASGRYPMRVYSVTEVAP